MSSAKSIAKNTGFLFSTDIFDKAISFILVIIITRYLGGIGFGKYSFAFAFISLFTILSNFGITTYIFREIAKDKSKTKKLVDNAMSLRLTVTLFIFSIAILIAKFWPKANAIIWAIIIAEIHEFLGMFNNLIQTTFRAHEKNEFNLYSKIIERSISLGLATYALTMGYGLYGLLWMLVISKIITSIYCYIISYKKFVPVSFCIDLKMWKNLIKNSLPFWFTLLFYRIYYKTDTVMLTAMKNYAVTGWYSAASTLVTALIFIPNIIINSVFPAMSRFHHSQSKDFLKLLYKKSFYYLLLISIPMSIGINLLAQRIILFIYKERFLQSGIILNILSLSLIFIFVNHIMGYLLNSINKQHLFTISNGLCALSNVTLNLILIPKFSYIGAAFATVTTQVINFGLLYYFTTKNGYPLNLIQLSYKPIASGILMGALIIQIRFLPIIYIIPISALFYFAILLSIGGFGKEEANLIKSFLPEKRG